MLRALHSNGDDEEYQIHILNKTSVVVPHHANTGFDEYKELMHLLDDKDLEDSDSDLINKKEYFILNLNYLLYY